MVTRVVALAAALLACACDRAYAQGDASTEADRRYDALAAEPTPATWHAGAVWVFVELDDKGGVRQSRTVRITDDAAGNNMDASDEWRALQMQAESPGVIEISTPVFMVAGRNLVVEWANMFHDSVAYVGELDAAGFKGRVRTSNYTYLEGPPQWHPSTGATVYGAPVAELPGRAAAPAPTMDALGAINDAKWWAEKMCAREGAGTPADVQHLQAEKTPYGWLLPSRWIFVEFGEAGSIRSARSVRLTDDTFAACGIDDWKRMKALDGPAAMGASPIGYRVQGRSARLLYDLDRCAIVTGELDVRGFHQRTGNGVSDCALPAGVIHGAHRGP